MGKTKAIYAADFETNTTAEDCRVWAWGVKNIYEVDDILYEYGNDIEGFMKWALKTNKERIIYFHNLKFDGNFIVSYLLKNGYEFDKEETGKKKTFYTAIDDTLQWYFIDIYYKNDKKITIRDSLKKIPMPIAKMPEAYDLNIEKGNLDDNADEGYNIIREVGHKLTEFEIEYLRRDIIILAKVLKIQYDNGLSGLTIASDAMKKFKHLVTKHDFDMFFPTLDISTDWFFRQAYRGGWTYCLKKCTEGVGMVFDVNSLYPSVLYSEINGEKHDYPFGIPEYYKGRYKKDTEFPLYIQHIRCAFVIKKGKLPMIQIKKGFQGKAEYTTESYETVDLYLTSIDLELFKQQYDILYIEYVDGFKMHSIRGIFDEYIDYFTRQKIEAGKAGNKALRTIAKLFLNSLYGKFGMQKIKVSKYPYLKEDGVVGFQAITYKVDGKEVNFKVDDAYRVDVAAFCTAYARRVTINAAQKAHDQGRFRYADTDSIHVVGTEPIPGLAVDPFKLGYWDHESDFKNAKYIRSKTYAEELKVVDKDTKEIKWVWDVKCCGMPAKMKDALIKHPNFPEIFDYGFNSDEYDTIPGRLKPKVVNGGVILTETPFNIKE